MNWKQRITLLLGTIALAGILLFPPWYIKAPQGNATGLAGRSFIFSPSTRYEWARIDTQRLIVELAIPVVLMIGLC